MVEGAIEAPGVLARVRLRFAQNPWGVIMTFLAPTLFFYLFFTAYPVLRPLYNSFHKILPNRGDEFIGLVNYIELLTNDMIFDKSVLHTFIWATVAPLVHVTLGP